MLEQFIDLAKSLDSRTIYIFLFLIAYLENVIPPIPGDLPVAFVGSLVALGDLSFSACVASASVGSLLGFASMYGIGQFIGQRIYTAESAKNSAAESPAPPVQSGILAAIRRFFPPESLDEVREKFAQYGYWLIAANRFLTGSRSIISVSAGLSHLNFFYVHLCALFSAVLWNALLVYGGYLLGDNWETLGYYITTYGLVFTVLVLGIVGVLAIRYIRKLQAAQAQKAQKPEVGKPE